MAIWRTGKPIEGKYGAFSSSTEQDANRQCDIGSMQDWKKIFTETSINNVKLSRVSFETVEVSLMIRKIMYSAPATKVKEIQGLLKSELKHL